MFAASHRSVPSKRSLRCSCPGRRPSAQPGPARAEIPPGATAAAHPDFHPRAAGGCTWTRSVPLSVTADGARALLVFCAVARRRRAVAGMGVSRVAAGQRPVELRLGRPLAGMRDPARRGHRATCRATDGATGGAVSRCIWMYPDAGADWLPPWSGCLLMYLEVPRCTPCPVGSSPPSDTLFRSPEPISEPEVRHCATPMPRPRMVTSPVKVSARDTR